MKKTKKLKGERKIERELLGIVIFCAVVVLVFFIAQQVIQSMNQFEYRGLAFTKTKFDQLQVYHYYYTWIDTLGDSYRYNLYLQTDPRENSVPIEGTALIPTRRVYLSLFTPNLEECEDSARALGDIALFLRDNQFIVESAIGDYTWAAVSDRKHVTCENNEDDTVIEFYRGTETEIKADNRCIQVSIGPDCEIFNAIEKLKLEIVINARERALN